MIIHRMETQPAPEPPVRFYKVIAVSFLLVTIALLGVVVFVTSKKAVVTVFAKEDSRNISLTLEVKGSANADGAIKGVVTSTMFHFSETYKPTGNTTVDGIATGEVTLINKTNTDQTLIKTTRLLTPNNILFRLSDKTVVPANGKVVAKVYSDKPGKESQVGPSTFVIPGLAADKQKVIYAESSAAMVGGVTTSGVLSDADLKAAELDYKQKAADAFVKDHPELGRANNGGLLVSVSDTQTSANHAIGEQITDFTLTGTSTVVVVSYSSDDLADAVSKKITAAVDTSAERLLMLSGKPAITLVHYDVKGGTAELSITQDSTVTLDADIEKLAPQHFIGKKKEEIERYIMGLDHVAGVEVKFSPSWMFSAPTVPDKIKVVVKNVQ